MNIDQNPMAVAVRSQPPLEVAVIGAGQAGVSLSYFLAKAGVNHVVFEKDRPFSAWHRRWDGFYANTPNWMNTLPGKQGQQYPGRSRSDFATKEELVDYFQSYLNDVDAPVLANQEVVEARQREDNSWTLRTSANDVFESDNIVVCTGAMSKPRIPDFSRSISDRVSQMHSVEYRRPTDVDTRHVLVVGSGSSGVQICKELLDAERFEQVHLACSDVLVLPNHVLGIPIHRLLHMLGIFDVKVYSRLGRVFYGTLEQKGDPIRPPTPRDLSRTHGLNLLGRLIDANDEALLFQNGQQLTRLADLTIIWCTGFSGDYGWIKPGRSSLELDERGYPVHLRGVIESHPGLYFVGLRYQYTVASHDIYGVGNDAKYVANEIDRRRRVRVPAQSLKSATDSAETALTVK